MSTDLIFFTLKLKTEMKIMIIISQIFRVGIFKTKEIIKVIFLLPAFLSFSPFPYGTTLTAIQDYWKNHSFN